MEILLVLAYAFICFKGILRKDLATITCLSPYLVINYDVDAFCDYMQNTKRKALTEEAAIGTALQSYNRSIRFRGVSCSAIQCFQKYVSTFLREHSCVRGKKVVVFLDPQGQELLNQCRDETRWMYFAMPLLMHWTTKTYQQMVITINVIGINKLVPNVSMENDYRMGLELKYETGLFRFCSILNIRLVSFMF